MSETGAERGLAGAPASGTGGVSAAGRRSPGAAWQRGRAAELLALASLLIVAALLRLPDLATRGTWDGDQGHDMLVLRALVRDGIVPLLGPPTSIGDVHHGAWYYYLLSPAAFLTGGDSPLAVVTLIAVAGVAAVSVVWWLARAVGGPVAGLVAAFAMAVSAAAIDESTFIWNPNLIPVASALAFAASIHAWQARSPRWWLLAGAGAMVTMQ
jgi:4-amino-4-deoxy-L-arabinose transferase-like glycosyltransferase